MKAWMIVGVVSLAVWSANAVAADAPTAPGMGMGKMMMGGGMQPVAEERESAGIPDAMKPKHLARMRSHLEAVNDIIAAIANGEFDKASETARTGLAMRGMGGGRGMGQGMGAGKGPGMGMGKGPGQGMGPGMCGGPNKDAGMCQGMKNEGFRALGMGREFTRGDRALYILTYIWTGLWFLVFVVGTIANLSAEEPLDDGAWIS